MGRGILGPDTRTLKECCVPVFETHATPVNVSVRPPKHAGCYVATEKKPGVSPTAPGPRRGGEPPGGVVPGPPRVVSGQGCACVIL